MFPPPEGGNALIVKTIAHFGRIDLLVNNAGICGSQMFEDATLDDFDRYWRVHLGGPVNTVKAGRRLTLREAHSPLGVT
jgi:NAD(P)-dependent dehydrogenase (short-subunit alcohol dehydrogenase family)